MIKIDKLILLNSRENMIRENNLITAEKLRNLAKVTSVVNYSENFINRADFLEKEHKELMDKIGDKVAVRVL